MPKVNAVILASGTGKRAKQGIPKQFINIAGKTIVEYTIKVFERNKNIDNIILVVNSYYRKLMERLVLKYKYSKVIKILKGGETRKDSSRIGINAIKSNEDIVLIHDAARPFLSQNIINNCVKALKKYDAVNVAIESTDTVFEVSEDMLIKNIPARKYIMRSQTPQGFKVGIIKKAHKMSLKDKDVQVTDDCALVLRYGLSDVCIVKGDYRNIKITYPEDVDLAEVLILD